MASVNDNLIVSSDLELLSSKVAEIKSKTNVVTRSVENSASSFGSTTIVPNCEFTIINKNNENIEILMNKINTEMDAILHIGEAIKNMDISLSNKASLLNCEIHTPSFDINSNNNDRNNTPDGLPEISKDSNDMIYWYERAKGKGVINE